MTENPQEQERHERDEARSAEAHWAAAEAAAGDAPTQKTPEGLEIPGPERREVVDALKKPIRPEKKPD